MFMNLETTLAPLPPLDWSTIDLVVFDVDGTLYDQRRLRVCQL